ncbi:LysR family transcriptional regulator [Caulobacter sp. UNC279MFTsu5.1]|uniref:LysR family transcriptional regulator n=1 Tax=Caulobacter sp. UNC279MFTsu5.1 TaxID=1502775 RepID=UPI00037778D5|nr:LysR family transcriptional regulator [Caulobacter sp. UNC279MFTsu5.1]SFJ08556.1 DNA-binding transcriptional regulator, LysR family [Caulobacter sp. UNC279MFTsu5.1]
MRDLDLTQVRAFVAAVDFRSFTAAGEALGATQSAISVRIDKLERALGARLLTRTPRTLGLTPAGQAFLERAREILRLNDLTLNEMSTGVATPRARLRLAVSDHAAGGRLVEIIKALQAHDRLLEVEVTTGLSAEMRAVFDGGDADAAIVRQDANRREGALLLRQPLVWAGATSGAHLAGGVDLVALRGPCGVKAAMTKALDQAGISWRFSFQGGSVLSLQAAVREGLGVSAFGPETLPPDLQRPQGELPPLPAGNIVLYSQAPAPVRDLIARAFRTGL